MITKTVLYSFDGLQRATREEVIEYVNQIMKELDLPVQPPEKIQIDFTIPCKEDLLAMDFSHAVSKSMSPSGVYHHAKRTGKRWKEDEQIVMTDPHTAYLYARDIIKGRWLEAEECIEQNTYVWGLYASKFGVRFIHE